MTPGKLYRYIGCAAAGMVTMYACSTGLSTLVRKVGDTDNVVLHLGHHNEGYRTVSDDTGWELVMASDGLVYYTFIRNVEGFWVEVES
jgi:hypothetical protein